MKVAKILLLVVMIGIWVAMHLPRDVKATETYVVKPNDTLWNIAQEYTSKDSRYINELIYDIVQDNPELQKNKWQVYPGQKLIINIK